MTRPKRQRRRLEFTPAWVENVKPEVGPVEYRDMTRRGLILRIEASGLKVWWARYRVDGKGEGRFRLGTFPETTLKKARVAALDAIAKAQAGADPQVERERVRIGPTVAKALLEWKADKKKGPAARWKGGLEGGTARCFLPHINRLERDYGNRRLEELTPRHVYEFVSAAETSATRNRSLTALRMFLKWARPQQLIKGDPTAEIEREKEGERTRTLTDDELRALIRGFDATRYGRAVRLLALTAVRRDEVLGAEWTWLDTEAATITIPPHAEKTGKKRQEQREERKVALCPAALDLLAQQREFLFARGLRSSVYIFPTSTGERPHADALKPVLNRLRGRRPNGKPASTDKRAKPRPVLIAEDVTIHDVRRTVADALLNRFKVEPWVVDHVVLGHVRPKLLRTYMPNLPLDGAREALARWSVELARILGEPEPQAAPVPAAQRDARA